MLDHGLVTLLKSAPLSRAWMGLSGGGIVLNRVDTSWRSC